MSRCIKARRVSFKPLLVENSLVLCLNARGKKPNEFLTRRPVGPSWTCAGNRESMVCRSQKQSSF
jgi:hypothetical protein